MEGYKQQSAIEPTLEPISDFVELEEILEDEDDQERETQIKDSQEGINMERRQYILGIEDFSNLITRIND